MPSRQTRKNWEIGAVDFLTDIDRQVEIPGFEGEEIKQSKLARDEAMEMLVLICEALGMDWDEFLEKLSTAWRRRRFRKGQRFGWFDDDETDNDDQQQ